MKIHAALKQQDAILCFCVSLGSADAVVRRGEKIKHLLTDYFLSNISVKKIIKIDHLCICQSYSKTKYYSF